MPSPRSPPSPPGIQTRLDGLAVGLAHQVALGAVDGAGGLDDLGQADVVSLGLELRAQLDGRGRDGVEGFDALFIEGFGELGGAIGALAEAGEDLRQLGDGASEERRGLRLREGWPRLRRKYRKSSSDWP